MYNSNYRAWNHTRSKAIIDHFGYKFFANKRILDLGSGDGELAAAFARLGAEVICCEIRDTNINLIHKNHAYLRVIKANLDSDFPFAGQQFDMVLSLGLLCHLKNYEKHINDILSISENIVLETEILDNNDINSKVPIFEDKSVNDFSFTGEGSIVSAANIENKLAKLGAQFKRIDDAKLNSGPFKYDWQEHNIGRRPGNRRFWFIKKDKYLQQIQANNAAMNKAKEIQNQPGTASPTMNFNSFSPETNLYTYGRRGCKKKIKAFIITYNS